MKCQLDKYLATRIFPVSLAGTSVFQGAGAGTEDALTLLIMADQRADREVYGRVYSGDWAEFAAKSDAWHAAKRRSRAAS